MAESSDPADRHVEFVSLLNAGHRRLLGYLVSLIGNRHDAEDVLQRACVTMWRKFEHFERGTDFLAWASTVAFYEAKNFQRTAARSRLHFSDELLQTLADERVADLARTDARHEALAHCLTKLDDAGRALLETAYGEEGSVVALAERLGRAPQTLYNKLNLLRRALAECVTGRLAEEAAQ
jgi:RNA polymerase sigma-70 factor (ECF subfamily)